MYSMLHWFHTRKIILFYVYVCNSIYTCGCSHTMHVCTVCTLNMYVQTSTYVLCMGMQKVHSNINFYYEVSHLHLITHANVIII